MGKCLCCVVISESKACAVESLGKYDRTLHSGFHYINYFIEKVSHIITLQLFAIDMTINTIT